MSLFRHNLGRYILTNPGNIGNNTNPTTLGNVEISEEKNAQHLKKEQVHTQKYTNQNPTI